MLSFCWLWRQIALEHNDKLGETENYFVIYRIINTWERDVRTLYRKTQKNFQHIKI